MLFYLIKLGLFTYYLLSNLYFSNLTTYSPIYSFNSCTARAYRSGTKYTVRNNLIALLRTAILTSPLVELHIARHTDQVAFTVFGHRIVWWSIAMQVPLVRGSDLRSGHQPAYAEI